MASNTSASREISLSGFSNWLHSEGARERLVVKRAGGPARQPGSLRGQHAPGHLVHAKHAEGEQDDHVHGEYDIPLRGGRPRG